MAQLVTMVNAALAVLPAAALFFWAYGRYDGAFRDNVVFLYFLGGLLMGFAVGLFSLFVLLGLSATLLSPILLAVLFPIAIIAGINRRKWQGERHAVFNGGSFALGVAVMLGFTLLYVLHPEGGWESAAKAATFAVGLSSLLFGVGLLAGNAVRLRKPFRIALMATATLLAPAVFVVQYAIDRTWLWIALLAAYGLIYAIVAERRILIEGVSEESRKQRRRLRRRALD